MLEIFQQGCTKCGSLVVGLAENTDLAANFLVGLRPSQPIHKTEAANLLPAIPWVEAVIL